jgi:hypothetical protein
VRNGADVKSSPGRTLILGLVGFAVAAPLALHVYLFSLWIVQKDYWQRTLSDFTGAQSALPPVVGNVLLGPALIAAGVALAFLVLGALLWRRPVAPAAEVPPATDMDLTPSRAAPVMGVIVLIGVALLYWAFF